jgi:potassium-transporting ATPase KdpC subunit
MSHALSLLRSGIALVLLFTFLLGGVYPLLVMAVSQMLFHHKANGSLIEHDGKVMGSTLLGQHFEEPHYFWGRLSATQPAYNPSASAGSNLSPANPRAVEAANLRVAALQEADPAHREMIPVELVTASASGLDPHISIRAAMYQLPRVARARGMNPQELREMMEEHISTPIFGFLGESYVNFVTLNHALDMKERGEAAEK